MPETTDPATKRVSPIMAALLVIAGIGIGLIVFVALFAARGLAARDGRSGATAV